MPKDRMTAIDKVIHELLFESKTFFTGDDHKGMKAVLGQIHESQKHILDKGKARGMLAGLDQEMKTKILTKCIHESLNRYVFQEVRLVLIKMEQSNSVSPMLLANPQSLKVTAQEGSKSEEMMTNDEVRAKQMQMINQLMPQTLKDFSQNRYAV